MRCHEIRSEPWIYDMNQSKFYAVPPVVSYGCHSTDAVHKCGLKHCGGPAYWSGLDDGRLRNWPLPR